MPANLARYGSLDFEEQTAFFRRKINIPTRRWNDLLRESHDRAFVVAGAMQRDLLADLRDAVDKGITQGTTLEEFRRDFADIVQKRGWTGWTGEGSEAGRAWRTRVIYETNLRTSYAAGRWVQIQAGKKVRPYLMYRHSPESIVPREQHLAWDGLILAVDDPFWRTHYPPNGWGCFPAGTEVATPAGWVPIERLGRGDRVFGGSGNVQAIQAPQVRPFDGYLIRVVTEQGDISATPNHRFLTARGWIRADHLNLGEVLVQIPEVSRLHDTIADIQHPHATGAQFRVPCPGHPPVSAGPKAFDSDRQARDEHVQPVREQAVIGDGMVSPPSQGLEQIGFRLGWIRPGVGMRRWVRQVSRALRGRHFRPHLWARGGRGALELFRRGAHACICFLGLPQPVMAPGGGLRQGRLTQDRGGSAPPVRVVLPLDSDPLAAIPGGYARPVHDLHDSPIPTAPAGAQIQDGHPLVDVEDPEGFVSGAPLDGFDSLEEFGRWALAHGVLSCVRVLERQPYTGSVYNLSITHDASYCLRVGVVHNCKCRAQPLSKYDLKSRGKRGPDPSPVIEYDPKTGMPKGIDPGWDYCPGASVVEDIGRIIGAPPRAAPDDDDPLQRGFLRRLWDSASNLLRSLVEGWRGWRQSKRPI